jgi:tetratricopeptide (TPR) repeat protein
MANRTDLTRWRQLWAEGAHGALLSELKEAMKAGPLPAEAYGLGALACIALERFDEAVKAGQNGVARAPREAWLFGALAEAYRGLARSEKEPAGDWAKAIAAADQAVRLAPTESAWAALGARLRREAGFPTEALQTAERGLERHPESVPLLVERGLARGETSDLRRAQQLAPTDPWPLEAEGMLHAQAGRHRAAASAFRRALRLAPRGSAAEAIEVQLAQAVAPRAAGLLRLLLLVTRITVIGWGVILFGYYIFFRLLQMGWKLAPGFKPVGQGLLLASAVGGALLVVVAHLTRLLLRLGRSSVQ